MSPCRVEFVRWKERAAARISNGEIELVVLLGGGHIADLRLAGSDVNALWEAPWPTIEPQTFSDVEHAPLYGERAVGKMLSGYTGHALAIGYFGMPSDADAKRGLALHGEAASTQWQLQTASFGHDIGTLSLEAELPLSELYVRRDFSITRGTRVVTVRESVANRRAQVRSIQWVEHVAFGEPLFSRGDASLAISAGRGITWPLGYEGHELLPNDFDFTWPKAGAYDLSQPFLKEGTGFVSSLRVEAKDDDAFLAVHNRKLALVAGYVFSARRFPWITLWEENGARQGPPWNGFTRVRGVEFGTSPMPLGLEHAQQMQTLFDTPVIARLEGNAELSTTYEMFVTPVPREWNSIRGMRRNEGALTLESDTGAEVELRSLPQDD